MENMKNKIFLKDISYDELCDIVDSVDTGYGFFT